MKYSRLFCFITAILLISIVLTGETREMNSPFSKLEQAVHEGKLSVYEAGIIKAEIFYRNKMMPEQFKVENPFVTSGTPYLLELERLMQTAPDYYREKYETIKKDWWVIPDSLDEIYITPNYDFHIHFTRTGEHATNLTDSNASGIPDYIEIIGEALEDAYDHYHNLFGYVTPPREGTKDGAAGGYNVYVYNWLLLGGFCRWVDYSNDMPEYPTRHTSYIGLHSNLIDYYDGEITTRGITAHEYAHSVQNGYYRNFKLSTFSFAESHANLLSYSVYGMEMTLRNQFNGRLAYPFLCLWMHSDPDFPYWGVFPYGNGIWVIFLYEYIGNFNHSIIVDLLDKMGRYSVNFQIPVYRPALREVIEEWSFGNYDLPSAYSVFTRWNYLVHEYFDNSGYSDENLLSRIVKSNHEIEASADIPFYGTGDPVDDDDYWVANMGSHYNIIHNPNLAESDTIQIDFQGMRSPGASWAYTILAHDNYSDWNSGWSVLESKQLYLAPFSNEIRIFNADNYNQIVFIVDNTKDVEIPEVSNYEFYVSFVQEGPDAMVSLSDIYYDPSSFQHGDIVYVHARVNNIGTQSIYSGTLNIFAGDHILASTEIGYINPGQYTDIEFLWDTSVHSGLPSAITFNLTDILPFDTDAGNNKVISDITGSVELYYFRASGKDNQVIIKWKTLSEINTNGFNIYRQIGRKVSPFLSFVPVKLNDEIIQGYGFPNTLQTYYFEDIVESGGNYIYIIESLNMYNEPERFQTRLFWD